jgi:hypothetical protein
VARGLAKSTSPQHAIVYNRITTAYSTDLGELFEVAEMLALFTELVYIVVVCENQVHRNDKN